MNPNLMAIFYREMERLEIRCIQDATAGLMQSLSFADYNTLRTLLDAQEK